MTTSQSDMPASAAAPSLRLRKGERLSHHSLVTYLHEKGKSEYAYPLRVIYSRITDEQMQHHFRGHIPSTLHREMMMLTVPKKRFRHAVDRVLLRRRMREAYRLNRDAIAPAEPADAPSWLLMSFIYVGDKKADFAKIQKKMRKLLQAMPATAGGTAAKKCAEEEAEA